MPSYTDGALCGAVESSSSFDTSAPSPASSMLRAAPPLLHTGNTSVMDSQSGAGETFAGLPLMVSTAAASIEAMVAGAESDFVPSAL